MRREMAAKEISLVGKAEYFITSISDKSKNSTTTSSYYSEKAASHCH